MGFLNTDCPNCGSENAYHNGVEYECPDCDYVWGGDELDSEEDNEEEDEN